MLSQHQQLRTRVFQVADGCLFAVALLAGYFLRDACSRWFGWHELEPIDGYLWMLPAVVVLGPLVLASQGFYEPAGLSPRLQSLFIVLRSCVFTVIGLILFLFIMREQLARSVIMLVGGIGGFLVYGRSEFTAWLDARRFAAGQLRRRALWVGRAEENARLRASLTRTELAGLEDVGDFDPGQQPMENFVRQLHEQAVNVVILNLAGVARDQASNVLRASGREGVEVLVRQGWSAVPWPRVSIDQFGGEAVFYYRAQSADLGHLLVKQVFDYVAAAILLIVLSPLILLIALAIRLTSPGPAFYRQTRAGINGRPFPMLKFRSMRVGAENQQAELASRNEMTGPVFKVTNDPRITPLGRFLRRHSLDELPQLWNVLRGEMSLVGPRPLPVDEVKRFDNDTHRRRLSVRPGLTCLWQISGRNDIADFEDWVRLDLAYIDQWSLWLDCKILVATIPVALFGRGAR